MRNTMMITALFAALSFNAQSETINVPGDFNFIQRAIDASSDGDAILVHPGTYKENIDYKGKVITVRSTSGPAETVIDGGQSGSVVVFISGENESSMLQGFTISNGSGTPYGTLGNVGGGIHCENTSPKILDNIIQFNKIGPIEVMGYGGGISCTDASPIIYNNIIQNNIVDGSGGGIFFWKASEPLIDGNIIRSNKAFYGGGIVASSTLSTAIQNNVIENNSASGIGGGMCCYEDAVVIYNMVSGNDAAEYGGGIWCSGNVTVKYNVISGNVAAQGGGVYNAHINPTISSNLIEANMATEGGGGIAFGGHASATCSYNIITSNNAEVSGGGIFCMNDTEPLIKFNVIADNFAKKRGGGLSHEGYESSCVRQNILYGNSATNGGGISCSEGTPQLSGNLVYKNEADYGGGIYLSTHGLMKMTANTIVNNTANIGGGFYTPGYPQPEIANTIIWDNQAKYAAQMSQGSQVVSYSDIQGGWPGINNIDSDPLFVDGQNDDYHLTFASPCKDQGNNPLVLILEDFEGDLRIADGIVDMGADEFYTHLYWKGDATPGGFVELKFIDHPGTSPVNLWIGSGVLDPPKLTQWGEWHLQFPVLGPLHLPPIPASGVYVLSGSIPLNPPAPYEIPMQALIGDALTNLSLMKIE